MECGDVLVAPGKDVTAGSSRGEMLAGVRHAGRHLAIDEDTAGISWGRG